MEIGTFWSPTSIVSTAKIQVAFEFNGQKYSHLSGDNPNKIEKGYERIWVKYADREINILYSPTYDQVLILKDDKETVKNIA